VSRFTPLKVTLRHVLDAGGCRTSIPRPGRRPTPPLSHGIDFCRKHRLSFLSLFLLFFCFLSIRLFGAPYSIPFLVYLALDLYMEGLHTPPPPPPRGDAEFF